MSLIDQLRFTFQCPANWDAMEGTEQMRFCAHCQKHVYDLSAMTREDAERLLATETKPCVRLERRPDGTAVFRGCPKTELNRKVRSRVAAGLAGGALALAACEESEARYPAILGDICLPEAETKPPVPGDSGFAPSASFGHPSPNGD